MRTTKEQLEGLLLAMRVSEAFKAPCCLVVVPGDVPYLVLSPSPKYQIVYAFAGYDIWERDPINLVQTDLTADAAVDFVLKQKGPRNAR